MVFVPRVKKTGVIVILPIAIPPENGCITN